MNLNNYLILKIPKSCGNYFIRKLLAKLHTSSNDLMIEKGRHHGTEITNRTCKQCDMQWFEEEYHVLLECLKYDDL